MNQPNQVPKDAKHYVSLTKASVYMVAKQMPNKDAYIKDVMANSEYTTENHIILSVEKYNELDRKYASKNKLRDKTKGAKAAIRRRGCSGCRRKKKP